MIAPEILRYGFNHARKIRLKNLRDLSKKWMRTPEADDTTMGGTRSWEIGYTITVPPFGTFSKIFFCRSVNAMDIFGIFGTSGTLVKQQLCMLTWWKSRCAPSQEKRGPPFGRIVADVTEWSRLMLNLHSGAKRNWPTLGITNKNKVTLRRKCNASWLLLFYSIVKFSNPFGNLHHAGPVSWNIGVFFSRSFAMKLKYPRLIRIRNCTKTYL